MFIPFVSKSDITSQLEMWCLKGMWIQLNTFERLVTLKEKFSYTFLANRANTDWTILPRIQSSIFKAKEYCSSTEEFHTEIPETNFNFVTSIIIDAESIFQYAISPFPSTFPFDLIGDHNFSTDTQIANEWNRMWRQTMNFPLNDRRWCVTWCVLRRYAMTFQNGMARNWKHFIYIKLMTFNK